MALSDKRILKEIEQGNIIITPFDRRNLATSSYDVTLGEFYYKPTSEEFPSGIYNIYDEFQTRRYWGFVQQAQQASGLFNDSSGIGPSDKVILIAPGETILAHTNEFIGGKNNITTMMKARSSMGRQGLAVCKCAGWGDVNYVNRWTMEITNYTKHVIPLVVGRRIAQIVFFETGDIENDGYEVKGKYQTTANIEELQRNWKPDDMLPRLYKDRDITS